MGLTWRNWTSVSDGSSTPGAPVAAVPWGNSFALFIADPGGGIYAIKAEPGFGWELVPGRSTKPGGHVTAVQSGNRFTLFMADVNGEIFRTSGIPYQGWGPWTSVSEGSSIAGAPVAAVPWENSFALFISDPGGGIYAIKAEPGFGWELVPGRSTKPGGHVTAVQSGNRFTLFMADVNGEIFRTSGIPYQGWDPWTSVSEGSCIAGAPVAAVPWENSFALFTADPGGGIYAIKAEPGFGWELVPGRSTKPGAKVTAVRWNQPVASSSSSSFLLLMADVNGEIFMTSGIPYQGWDPWTSPSDGISTPGAEVTVVPSPAYALHFALFIADPSGGLYTTSPAPPPVPTGLHFVSLSPGGAAGTREARIGWTAVVPVPDSVYKIGYQITYYRADSSGPRSGGFSDGNWAYISLREGHTYNVYVQATYYLSNVVVVPDAQSAPSNTIAISVPISPPGPQVVTLVLDRQMILEGPIPYGGIYHGSHPGHLQKITIPERFGLRGLQFVKVGHSSEECNNPDAVVAIPAGGQTTPDQLSAIFGAPYPIAFPASGFGLVACILQPPGAPLLDHVGVQLTVILDG